MPPEKQQCACVGVAAVGSGCLAGDSGDIVQGVAGGQVSVTIHVSSLSDRWKVVHGALPHPGCSEYPSLFLLLIQA